MPQPVVQTAKAVNPNTNLTRTQEALLSPEEQVIASKRTVYIMKNEIKSLGGMVYYRIKERCPTGYLL